MCEKLTGATEESSAARTLLNPIFDQLEGFIQPIQSAIEAVEEAASRLNPF
jgi:hypothetical protein